ncbi:MAG: AAA family ATPase [Bradymonadia bacterium]
MITAITLKNCFTHHERTFEFKQGLTVITGPNESGKSLILEMIRFALFGSAALRGTADDYRKLEVILDFMVQGAPHQVRRKGNRAWLFRDGEPLAEGIRPVNAAIRRTLGYDMTVFDTANACNQGQIEALGSMTPSQRKHMVDQTVGLSLLEGVGQWVSEQARAFDREAEAMARVIEKPVAPEEPSGYAPSAQLKLKVHTLQSKETARAALVGWLAHTLEAPVEPVCPTEETVEILRAKSEARRAVVSALQAASVELQGLPPISLTAQEVDAVEAQWALWHQHIEKRRALAGLEPPELTLESIEVMEQTWAQHDRWLAKSELLAHGELECPSCGHQWPQAAEALEAYADVDPVEPPATGRAALRRARAVVEQWQQTAELRAHYADVPDDMERPNLTEEALRQARLALSSVARREALNTQVAELQSQLADYPDVDHLLQARQRYDLARSAWSEAQGRYTTWLAERTKKEAELETLVEVPEQLSQARESLTRAVVYEGARQRYTHDLERYEAAQADLQARQAEAEHWRSAKRALVDLRGRIKGFLLPSLNTVASRLLSQMTGGVRGDVKVDEQFNIAVDGQPLATLSGSGKAVANLALRLALGQVLTHRVFPVFLADEVDAAMDRDRAGFTVDALRGLTRSVAQVILVSHKEIDSEHVIRL